MKHARFAAVFCILLIVMLPVVQAQNTGNTTQPLAEQEPLSVKPIPAYSRLTYVDVEGKTSEGARIVVYINDVKYRESVSQDGSFDYRVPLPKEQNTIRIEAFDSFGVLIDAKEYSVILDTTPPKITLDRPIEKYSGATIELKGSVSEPVALGWAVVSQLQNTSGETAVQGSFSIPITLFEGVNEITLSATDRAGNKAVIQNKTILDTQAPQFVETNLEQLSPTYKQTVTVKGKLSEPGIVFIYLGNDTKPSYDVITNDEGVFSKEITLRRVQATAGPKKVGLETDAWSNKVRLEAVDYAGLKTTYGPVEIIYTLCGYGSWYSVQMGKPLPNSLIPRLVLDGIQQIGIPFTLEYKGGRTASIDRVEVVTPLLSPKLEKEYDNGLVSARALWVPSRNQTVRGYIQIQFNPFDPLPEKQDATTYEKEELISKHRVDECETKPFGCMKLFLILEIAFREKITTQRFDPSKAAYIDEVTYTPLRQKVCIPVEIMIEPRLPPNKLPKKFLERTRDNLDKAIEGIDRILGPLEKIGTFVLGSCLALHIPYYYLYVKERWNCEVSSLLSVFSNGGFNKAYAEAGVCDATYNPSGDDKEKEKNKACKSCESAIKTRKDFEIDYFRQVCDRVACPSAPSLQTYIKSIKGGASELKPQPSVSSQELDKFKYNGKYYSGSSCALVTDLSYNNLKRLFDIAQGTQAGSSGLSKADCEKTLHPAHPDCCGVEYLQEWNTACTIMNELKESVCLASQKEGGIGNTDPSLSCNRLWNSVAGFCEPNTGQPVTEAIPTGLKYRQGSEPAGAKTNEVYIIVIPRNIKGVESYEVRRGGVKEGFVAAMPSTIATTGAGSELPLNPRISAVVDSDDLSEFFKKPKPDFEGFKNKFYEDGAVEQNDQRLKAAFNSVVEKVTVPEQEFIVIPESGFLRSLQCVCLPAITSWLNMWRNILAAVRNCINTILVTGEGSEGVCKEVLSRYVCDLLYEAIACFTQKWGSPGSGKVVKPGIGNLMSVLVGAGTDVSTSVRNRYGDTAMFKVMFSERKLVHAVCLFAFTGSWNLDVSGLFKQTVDEIPIQSTGFLAPFPAGCERRFISYNPTTSPPGLATWNYHFGVGLAAGADVRYTLELVCSKGFRCNPAYGFRNGECDCNKRPTEQRLIINPPELGTGQLRKGEILNEEIYYTIDAGSPESSVRYDKAVLKWEWNDPKSGGIQAGQAECNIGLAGGEAPVFCSFDVFSLSYRCSFGAEESAITMQDVSPVYKNELPKTKEQVFGIGEPFVFDVAVKQKLAEDRRNPGSSNKFLYYKITSHSGDVVVETTPETSPGILFDRDGEYTKQINITLPNTIVASALDKSAFAQQTGCWARRDGESFGKTCKASDYVGSYEITMNNKPISAVVVLDKGVMNIHELESSIPVASTGFGEGRELFKGISQAIRTIEGNKSIDGNNYAYSVTLKRTVTGERVELFLPPPQDISTPCDTKQMTFWKATFTMYDATKYGEPSSQVSVDPVTGEVQQKDVVFSIACLNQTELSPIKKQAEQEKQQAQAPQQQQVPRQQVPPPQRGEQQVQPDQYEEQSKVVPTLPLRQTKPAAPGAQPPVD